MFAGHLYRAVKAVVIRQCQKVNVITSYSIHYTKLYDILDTVIQRRAKVNPRLILGKGKLADIIILALQVDANLLIFNQDLNPSQVRSITDFTDLRVIDRTQLILDIFARRAMSRVITSYSIHYTKLYDGFLSRRGCSQIQGYLFSRPAPAPEFEKLIGRGL